jgi:hypothetical protein
VYIGDQRCPGFNQLAYARALVYGRNSVAEIEFKTSLTDLLKIIHSDLSDMMTQDPSFVYSMRSVYSTAYNTCCQSACVFNNIAIL